MRKTKKPWLVRKPRLSPRNWVVGSHSRAVEARATAVSNRETADKEAADAKTSAEAAASAAELAAKSALAAKQDAAASEVAMAAAGEALAVVKEQCKNTTQGTFWWLDREWKRPKNTCPKQNSSIGGGRSRGQQQ